MTTSTRITDQPATEPATDELFTGTRWTTAVAAAYDLDVRWIAVADRSYPFVVRDDLTGRRVITFPYSDYLPVTDDANEARTQVQSLVEGLSEAYPRHRIEAKLAVDPAALPAGLSLTRRAVYHRCPAGAATSPSFRRAVRKAERAGVTVGVATDAAAVDRFYALYCRQRVEKFGSLPQPTTFLRSVSAAFIGADRGMFLEAYYSGELVASALLLRQGRGLFYKFGSSRPEALGVRPNNLIFAAAHDYLSENRLSFLDLGLSGTSDKYAGLRRFKESVGGVAHPICYVAHQPADYDDAGPTAFRTHLTALTRAVVDARPPRATVDAISHQLYPFFA